MEQQQDNLITHPYETITLILKKYNFIQNNKIDTIKIEQNISWFSDICFQEYHDTKLPSEPKHLLRSKIERIIFDSINYFNNQIFKSNKDLYCPLIVDKEKALNNVLNLALEAIDYIVPKDVSKEKRKIHASLLLHWMFNFKRKYFYTGTLLPNREMLLMFYSKEQGTGKSYFVREVLLRQFRQFDNKAYFEGINFPSEGKMRNVWVEEMGCICFDDLSDWSHTEFSTIMKHFIDNSVTSYNKKFANESFTKPSRASFIGTSNIPLADIIKDTTGARRFWEIPVSNMSSLNEKVNGDYKRKTDILKDIFTQEFWQQIDVYREDAYLPEFLLKEVTDIQNSTLRNKDSVEMFLEQFNIDANTEKNTFISIQKLFDVYTLDCQRKGIKSLNTIWFSRKITMFENLIRLCVSKNERGYLINKQLEQQLLMVK